MIESTTDCRVNSFFEEAFGKGKDDSTRSSLWMELASDVDGGGCIVMGDRTQQYVRLPLSRLEKVDDPHTPSSEAGDLIFTFDKYRDVKAGGLSSVYAIYDVYDRVRDIGGDSVDEVEVAKYLSVSADGYLNDTQQPVWHIQKNNEDSYRLRKEDVLEPEVWGDD